MKRFAITGIAAIVASLLIGGCGSKDPDTDPALAKAAPPPGPNADLNPPTNPNKHIPKPPMAASPGGPGGPGGSGPGLAKKPATGDTGKM